MQITVYDIAADKNVKPGQIALAWLLHKGQNIIPIPGTKHRSHLEDNPAAVEVALDETQMRIPDEALAPGKVSGQCYADWIMETVNR